MTKWLELFLHYSEPSTCDNAVVNNSAVDILQQIRHSTFLNKSDLNSMCEMATELQDTFEKKQIWRTQTEIEVSVLNDIKFPTKASKYWQCVREQAVFFENLIHLSFNYRRNMLKIERLKQDISDQVRRRLGGSNLYDRLLHCELGIDLEEAEYNQRNYEIQASDRVREIKIWSMKKEELDDGSFDTENVNTHQLLSYTEMFLRNYFASQNMGSLDERINLEAQLITSLRACKKQDILEQVLCKFTDEQKKHILDNLEKGG